MSKNVHRHIHHRDGIIMPLELLAMSQGDIDSSILPPYTIEISECEHERNGDGSQLPSTSADSAIGHIGWQDSVSEAINSPPYVRAVGVVKKDANGKLVLNTDGVHLLLSGGSVVFAKKGNIPRSGTCSLDGQTMSCTGTCNMCMPQKSNGMITCICPGGLEDAARQAMDCFGKKLGQTAFLCIAGRVALSAPDFREPTEALLTALKALESYVAQCSDKDEGGQRPDSGCGCG